MEISVGTVEQLVRQQFPALSALPIAPLESSGTVNALFRLGDELLVRMPFQIRPAADVRRELVEEHDNARLLRTAVTLPVPQPVALGEPGADFPMPWSIYRWLTGEIANPSNSDSYAVARALAGFVREVGRIDTSGRSFVGNWRGGRLIDHDATVLTALSKSHQLVDTFALQRIWEKLRDTPRIDEPDRWTHGDLMPGNLLIRHHRLVAVIDVGGLAVRDPAVDLAPAWNLFSAPVRAAFRADLDVAQHTWDRGKAWSLVQAASALHYYVRTNPPMAQIARRTLLALLDDDAGKHS